MTTEIKFDKRCPKCGQIKPLTEFDKNAFTADERGAYRAQWHRETVAKLSATPGGSRRSSRVRP